MKKTRLKQLWVDEEYKKKFKIEATKKGMSLVEYSKYLTKKTDEDVIDEKKFNFRL